MKNKLLNLILAFAIVIQSFVAIANSQETHELDVQHIQTEHSHEYDHDKLVAHQYLYSFQYANPHHDNPIIPPIS